MLTLLSLSAQAQRLSGKVVDAETGLPVPYASVSVLHSRVGTTSNAEGEFELRQAVLPGKLVVSELSHRTDTVAVASASAVLQVRLKPTAVVLPEVKMGSYTAELIKKAYRQLERTNAQQAYSAAFYRQVTRLDNEPTEIQEMIWHAKSGNTGLAGTAMAQGRYAKKKTVLNFKNFSLYTKKNQISLFKSDTALLKTLLGPNPTELNTLRLLGVTQDGTHQLVEIGFAKKAAPNTEYGSLLIDETTLQVLRYRTVTQALNVRINNPAFKLTNQATTLEWVFRPTPTGGAALLDHIKVDYQATLHRPLRSDMKVQASSFTLLYDGQTKAPADVTYAAAQSGESDLQVIEAMAYNAAFWQNNSAVKRTPLEEAIIKAFEQKGAFGTMLTP
ncbi:CarboxypepD_reg-like domain-containing protein [Hymenobacter gelipurpurascens]|uniref:CarboxypepD_reg-like domain-containing protein n=2 Tax=Hymenobacter gelipurpurascens TaxID=89968 RepID=A0A212UG85_9BACT|nr:CarboxypepD_reg-like domain-containing protein [Hymenobacter gelipurpurascens]